MHQRFIPKVDIPDNEQQHLLIVAEQVHIHEPTCVLFHGVVAVARCAKYISDLSMLISPSEQT